MDNPTQESAQVEAAPPRRPPRALVAPKSRHKAKKSGPPYKYPWHTLALNQMYYIPTNSGTRYSSIEQAVYRQNRINMELRVPERFRVLNSIGDHPTREGVKVWTLQRYA